MLYYIGFIALLYMRNADMIMVLTINLNFGLAPIDVGQMGSLEPGKQAYWQIIDPPCYGHLGYRFGGNLVEVAVKRRELVAQ